MARARRELSGLSLEAIDAVADGLARQPPRQRQSDQNADDDRQTRFPGRLTLCRRPRLSEVSQAKSTRQFPHLLGEVRLCHDPAKAVTLREKRPEPARDETAHERAGVCETEP